jgi:hypothetical protein
LERIEKEGEAIYIFQVNRIWKGNKYSTVQIKTPLSGPACGMLFSLKEEYYVFSDNGRTSSCSENSKTSKINFDGILKLNLDNEFKNDVGKNGKSELTKSEAEYFNATFGNERGQFDFTGKKVGFINYKTVTDKVDYFKRWRFKYNEPDIWTLDRINLLVLTASEKKSTDDLDALFILTEKTLTKAKRSRILKKLKERTNAQQHVSAMVP